MATFLRREAFQVVPSGCDGTTRRIDWGLARPECSIVELNSIYHMRCSKWIWTLVRRYPEVWWSGHILDGLIRPYSHTSRKQESSQRYCTATRTDFASCNISGLVPNTLKCRIIFSHCRYVNCLAPWRKSWSGNTINAKRGVCDAVTLNNVLIVLRRSEPKEG